MGNQYKNYIGIDISKDWLDVAIVRPRVGNECISLRIDNNLTSLKQLKKDLIEFAVRFNKETLVLMEHTGVYKTHLVKFLITQNCPICIESAFRIKRSLGIQRGKNDQIDAKRIAQNGLLHSSQLTVWQNPRKSILILKDLLINRDRLLKAKKSLQLPLNEFKEYYSRGDYKYFVNLNDSALHSITSSIAKVDSEIENIISRDSQIRDKINLVTSVPGVGLIVALNLLCYTNEFTLYQKGSQLASYAGVAPFQFKSGTSVKGKSKVHPFANKKLKSLLHIAAVANLRSKNELRAYYDRKVAEGKNKMSVLNAIRNKIVLRVAAVIARATPYTKIKKELGLDDPELYHVQSS